MPLMRTSRNNRHLRPQQTGDVKRNVWPKFLRCLHIYTLNAWYRGSRRQHWQRLRGWAHGGTNRGQHWL